MEVVEHEVLLNKLLSDLPTQPHSNPAWAQAGQAELHYKHIGPLTVAHGSKTSKEATSAAAVSGQTFQDIQDGNSNSTVKTAIKVEHVALTTLKNMLKLCQKSLKLMDASANDTRKVMAAFRAKAGKTTDCDQSDLLNRRAEELDLANAHFLTFQDDFLAFTADANYLDDSTSDDQLQDKSSCAEAFLKKSTEHLDCLKRLKAAAKP